MFIIEMIARLQIVVASPYPGLKLTVEISALMPPENNVTCKMPNVIKEGQNIVELGFFEYFAVQVKQYTHIISPYFIIPRS